MNNNKIEINFEHNVLCNTITMKPIYGYNKEFMCGEIKYFDKIYLLDLADKDKIINYNKSFIFVTENDIYPSFPTNYKRFTYLDFIFTPLKI